MKIGEKVKPDIAHRGCFAGMGHWSGGGSGYNGDPCKGIAGQGNGRGFGEGKCQEGAGDHRGKGGNPNGKKGRFPGVERP